MRTVRVVPTGAMRGDPDAFARDGAYRRWQRLEEAVSDMWGMHDVGWGWWLVSILVMVGFWAAVIYGVVWLARNNGSSTSTPEQHEAPEDVLKRRLAAGEISVEEYERVQGTLSRETSAEPREPASR